MLSRSIKSLPKGTTYKLIRASSIAHYHHSTPLYKKAAELQEDNSPIDKFAQGINVIKSTILNAPPLRKITRPNIESLPFTGQATTWDQAVKEAQSLVNAADQERIFDPVKLIGADLWELKGNITKLLGSGHPFINTIGKHYLQGDTNRIRPLLVLLIAKATSLAPKKTPQQLLQEDKGEDELSLTTLDNPILPTQRRLAEISEMIYTASLLHYDVIDHADQVTSPGFGNKMAVLAGDFLLARSSLALAQLKKAECIELIATCIANLVESEFMKLEDIQDSNKAFDYYIDKIYKKTGSLIAQSCKASAVLAGCTVDISQTAYDFGKNLGIALQLFDDLQHFSSSKSRNHELISAPLLLAYKGTPELGPIIKREFSQDGDKEQARMLVYQSNGLQMTHELATKHIDAAILALDKLPNSDAKLALVQLAKNLPTRKE